MRIMSYEERFDRIERQLESIVGIQAQLVMSQQQNDTAIGKLADVVSSLARVLDDQGDRMEAGFGRVEEQISGMNGQMSRLDEQISGMYGQMSRLDEQMARTEAQMARTDEQMARTDERLNILIGIVERYFSDGHH